MELIFEEAEQQFVLVFVHIAVELVAHFVVVVEPAVHIVLVVVVEVVEPFVHIVLVEVVEPVVHIAVVEAVRIVAVAGLAVHIAVALVAVPAVPAVAAVDPLVVD